MSVGYALLGLLEDSDRHGYELKQEYDRHFGGAKPLQVGHVYRILAQLLRGGQIAEAGVEHGGGPDRKRYAITDAGVLDLSRWLREPEQPQPHLQAVLFTKVVLALLSGRPAHEFLDAQRETHTVRMHQLIEAKRGAAPRDALLADYQLFHIEADLRWIDHAQARLTTLTGGIQ